VTTAGVNDDSWDWRNHLDTSLVASISSTYSYDENEHRVRIDDGTTIFHNPNDLYRTR